MKVINVSSSKRSPLDRNEYLDAEIRRLFQDLLPNDKLPARLVRTWLVETKEGQLKCLEAMLENHNINQQLSRAEEQAEERANFWAAAHFHLFPRLPIELRRIIWKFAFEDELAGRIHCIRESNIRPGLFKSNQPLSPILHVNREARNIYMSSTTPTSAFGTYINFSRDTIYYFATSSPGLGWKSWLRFLNSKDSEKIEKLAMQHHAFRHLPCGPYSRDHVPSRHWNMRAYLQNWWETALVFGDYRTPDAIWRDRMMEFRDYSSRERRRYRDVWSARKYAAYLDNLKALELDGADEVGSIGDAGNAGDAESNADVANADAQRLDWRYVCIEGQDMERLW